MIRTYEEVTTIDALAANEDMLDALESGALIYLPSLSFNFSSFEEPLLQQDMFPLKSKNISYDSHKQQIKAFNEKHESYDLLKNMMHRYADFSQVLLTKLFPHYESHLVRARTSFRPVEIEGRQAPSYRKDDTRLHVDSFPASPCQGRRLLRVFSNVNPDGKPRVWRVGDEFESVVNHFKTRLKRPLAFYKYLLKSFKITRGLRTDYDALMLQLHDTMKSDLHYQKTVKQQTIDLATNSVWIVYTDQVSHAALKGQFCLEQTFTLPVNGMKDPQKSPLRIMENIWQCSLT